MDAVAGQRAFKYRAFVSYAHRDKRIARRLFRALEAFRAPAGVAAEGLTENRRLGRLFRDDDELGAKAHLTDALQDALADAENLIVVCSPHAAASKWVNGEITLFRTRRSPDRIWAVIVGGEPDAAEPARQCFPQALREDEPLAPDLRKEGLPRTVAKLAAAMLGLDFEDLWRRAQKDAAQAARRRAAIQAGVGAVIAALAIGLFMVDSNDLINDGYIAAAAVREGLSGHGASWAPSPDQRAATVAAQRAVSAYLRQDLAFELKERNPQVGWTIAQEELGVRGQAPRLDAAAMQLMMDRRLPGQPCWPEYVADGGCHVLATSWAATTEAAAGAPAAPELLAGLLDLQSPQGWWSLYYAYHDDRTFASTNATAWALMALDAQSTTAGPALRARIETARRRAAGWLLATEDPGRGRWKDYPFNPDGAFSDGVSAIAVVSLNRAAPGAAVDRLDRGWLARLPVFPGKLGGLERSNVALGRSWKWDRTSYVVTPWVALSTFLAYPKGDWLERAKADAYLDRFAGALRTYKGDGMPGFFSAELLACLNQISQPPSSSPAPPAAARAS